MNNLTKAELDQLLMKPKEAAFREAVDTAGSALNWLISTIGQGLANIRPNVSLRSSALPRTTGFPTYGKIRRNDP